MTDPTPTFPGTFPGTFAGTFVAGAFAAIGATFTSRTFGVAGAVAA